LLRQLLLSGLLYRHENEGTVTSFEDLQNYLLKTGNDDACIL